MNTIDLNVNYLLKQKTTNYSIPEKSNCFSESIWKLSSFMQIKQELNECKNLLNDINLDEWSSHTQFTDSSQLICHQIVKKLKSKPLLLTRAWIKLYQILSDFKIIERHLNEQKPKPKSINCLLLCECPGGFVNALNHYIISHFNHNLKFLWTANTLNPYYEQIDYTIIDDEFIKDINCFNNWFFGSTNTGNILDKSLLTDLKKKVSNGDKFDLITCDGSINCVDCPESQEEVIIPLLFSEIIISLNVIKEGGSLVIKCFTLYECQTLCLLYLLCCSFDSIHVFKPTASKSGNSEIYLICIGFKANEQINSLICLLSEHKFTDNCKALFPLQSLSQQFLAKVEECVKLLADRQKLTIKTNLQLFNNISENKKQQIINHKKYVAKSFIKKYNIFSISVFDELVPNLDYQQNNCLRFKKLSTLLNNSNSYNNRKQIHFFSQIWFKKLSQVLNDMTNDSNVKNQLNDLKRWKPTNSKPFRIHLVFGQTYNQILCSKFCDLSLLISYNHCIKYSEKFGEIGKTFISFSYESVQILRSLISDLETEMPFSRIISFDDSIDFTEQFRQLLVSKELQVVSNSLNISFESNSKNVFIINAFHTFSLDLMNEKLVLNELIRHLCQMFSLIGENDLLVIQIGFSLTRLTTAVLYMISKSFKYFSLVPCIDSDIMNRHGLICLFKSKRDDKQINSQIADHFSHILSQMNSLTELKSEEVNYSLVEIISVPLLVSDTKFYETLFNANSIHMMEILKQMSAIITNNSENN